LAGYHLDIPTRAGSLHQYFASEDEGVAYYQETLEKLWLAGAIGMFAWCYADYDPSLFDRPPCDTHLHERSFGLVRADGALKPAAEVVRRFAATTRALRRPPNDPVFLELETFYLELPHSLERRFRSFRV
jgi:endo-1,4-beta-mannosidase